jgi:hypothetical protein
VGGGSREKHQARLVKTLAADRLIKSRAVNSKEQAVAGLVLIAVVVSCAHAASRVLDALAQRIILGAHRDLVQVAASLPPGAEVREESRVGTWQVRAGQAPERGRK